MITVAEFLLFSNRTMSAIRAAVAPLGNDTLNCVPQTATNHDMNSVFQLANHATAAALWWTSHIICGHESARDRDAEFTSEGGIDVLLSMLDERQMAINALEAELSAATALANHASTEVPLGRPWTVGAALMHTYEELAQHLGHIEVTLDLVRT